VSQVNPSEHTNADLNKILDNIKTIALVGASPKPERPSYEVMSFLQSKGYKVTPVNPGMTGKQLLGEQVIGSVADIPKKVDMIEIFRNSEAAGEICKQVLDLDPSKLPDVIWMQIGVINHEAAKLAEEKGITVIMDKCPKRVIQNY